MHDAAAHDRVGRAALMSWPRNFTWPLSGSMMPEIVFSVVVLPAPFAPSTVTILPFGHREADAAQRLHRAVVAIRR